jgi:hypothetical protein
MLVLAAGFKGRQQGDVAFLNNDPCIDRLAIVGEGQWEERARRFTAKRVRRFPIEYLQPAESPPALAWLEAERAQRVPATQRPMRWL